MDKTTEMKKDGMKNYFAIALGRCRRQKKILELSAALCYPLDRKRRLLVTDALQEPHSKGGVSQAKAVTSQ